MAENFQCSGGKEIALSQCSSCELVKWKVSPGQKVSKGSILAVYKKCATSAESAEAEMFVLPKLKAQSGGSVMKLLVTEGDLVKPGQAVILMNGCDHKIVMKEMCAECGADLRQEPGIPGDLKEPVTASVALVHNIPELRVSQKEAEIIATKDKESLLRNGKLVLLVDLDQTLIHTTTENIPSEMKDVYHFQLYGQNCWYHSKFRPGWQTFLENLSKYFELHIFTMGSRLYAHTIARLLDPSGMFFADRIRSRDESFDMCSKYHDLRALFPCDDSMVCIIDDREDIWDSAPNLVTVRPYRYFSGTGDINAPPGSQQAFTHTPAIPLHKNTEQVVDRTDGVSEDGEGSIGKEIGGDIPGGSGTGGVGDESNTGGVTGVMADDKHRKIEREEDNKSERCEIVEEERDCSGNDEGASGDCKNSQNDESDCKHPEDHDDYLLYLEEILRRIHRNFYEIIERNEQLEEQEESPRVVVTPDLREIIPQLRRDVLKGVNIVFTGMIPTNNRPQDSQPWKIAKRFGADVSKELLTRKNTADHRKRTTHVVAARPGTEKACRAARMPDVRLVNPNWLWTCAERWELVEERLFPVEENQAHKSRHNDTPNASRRSTPRGGSGKEGDRKFVDALDEISEENMKIVFNPFLSFSRREMEAMDKEVEELMRCSDDDDDEEDETQGPLSNSSSSNRTADRSSSRAPPITEDDEKRRETTFSTIKESEENHPPSKRRKLVFNGEESNDGSSEGEFSLGEDSSGSNSGDEEGDHMAALLEAELFHV